MWENKIREPPNMTKELSHVMRMKLNNARKSIGWMLWASMAVGWPKKEERNY